MISVVFGGGYFLAFTQSGNNILKPFINSYLKQKVKVASIMIKSFTLKPNHLVADASVNNMANIKLDGDFDISGKKFDFTYTVDAKEIKTKDFNFNEKIYIKGKAFGDIKKAKVFGVGKVANSDIDYKLDLIDKQPQNITAKIDRANLKKLLLLAGQKPYANGTVTLDVNIPKVDEKNLQGKAKLSVVNGIVNSTLVAKDFKITLPPHTSFNLNSDANLNKDTVFINTKLLTSLANLIAKKTIFNIKTNTLKSDFYLDAPNLAKLNSLTKMKLRGDFKANGTIKFANKLLSVVANTKSLGGKTTVVYSGDMLKASLNQASTDTIFYKLNLPNYTSAKVDGDFTLTSIKKLLGKFNIKANGIYKMQKQNINYQATTAGHLKNQKVFAVLDAKTNLGVANLKDIVFDIKTANLTALYSYYLDNLAKLNSLTGQKLVGDIKTTGNIKKDKDLLVKGTINKFDGVINYQLLNSQISAIVNDAKVAKIEKTLSYPIMIDALANAKFDYNLDNSKGKATIKMTKAKMLPNKFTKIVLALRGLDLSKEHYNDTTLVARLSKNLIDFDFDAKSKSVILSIKQGKIYQPSGKLDAKLLAQLEKDKIQLKIAGTTSNPKIKLDSSFLRDKLKSDLKQKAKDKLKAKLADKLHLKSTDTKQIKQELKQKAEDKLKEKLKNELFKKLF